MRQGTDRREVRGARALAAALLLPALLVLVALSCGPLRTLTSLGQVDGHPLYVMHYYGPYSSGALLGTDLEEVIYAVVRTVAMPDGCTCFASLNPDAENVFGRNFDWHDHPALLLFTDPPNGFASVSMVDIHYLGFDANGPSGMDRVALLLAPFIPFDGMNEAGVAVGMMAVPHAQDSEEPGKPTIDSLRVIRVVLDEAGSTEEAITLLEEYNIVFDEPPIHYLISDALGSSAIVEFVDGEMRVLYTDRPWQVATNFIVSDFLPSGADSPCSRYNRAYQALSLSQGKVSQSEAMAILESVSSPNTIWSAVYGMTSGDVEVVMGKQYDQVHTFELPMQSAETR